MNAKEHERMEHVKGFLEELMEFAVNNKKVNIHNQNVHILLNLVDKIRTRKIIMKDLIIFVNNQIKKTQSTLNSKTTLREHDINFWDEVLLIILKHIK